MRSRLRLLLSVAACAVLGAAVAAPALGAAGDLDPTFDVDGKVITPTNLSNSSGGMVLQTDQKIVAVGTVSAGGGNDFIVRRYNTDGSLDSTFGSGGTALVDFPANNATAFDVAVQPDGKIVVVGHVNGVQFALARLQPNGTLDSTFDLDGRVLGPGGEGLSVALQPDLKIVVGGESPGGNFRVARYLSDGSLDTLTWGPPNGFVDVDFGAVDHAHDIAIQTDGRVVAAGMRQVDGSNADFAVARFTVAGVLDPFFGSGGMVTTSIGPWDHANKVELQSDGRIVVAGETGPSQADGVIDVAVVRYLTTGGLDPSFDTDGRVVTDANGIITGPTVDVSGLAIQPDGRIYAGGTTIVAGSVDFFIARYLPNGALDPSWSGDGKVSTPLQGADVIYDLALQADGKLLAFGLSDTTGAFLLARYLGIAPPTTLTLEPTTDTNPVGEEHCVTATARDAALQPVPDVTVRFSVTGANTASGMDVTDANGEATFCYTGTAAGTDTISAFADTNNDGDQDDGEPSGTATKTYLPGPPANLTLEPESDTNTIGVPPPPHCVTATVTDQYGNPVPGVAVDFSVSGANTAAGAGVTDANGQTSFCYTGTVAGTDTITATAQGGSNPSDTATKVWEPGPPASLVLDPPTATNTVGAQHCVTATVRDFFGNPTPGITVRFTVTGANTASGTDVTDANGQATFCYTGANAGTDTIQAYADTNNNNVQDPGEPTGSATKEWTSVCPPGDDDGDDDGLRDRNENLFGNLLNNADSDDDGIRDGNDDGDDDGEDDEDEDDDEGGACPDEDSDDDGEDDEDEDDEEDDD